MNEQKRIKDPWDARVMMECRQGKLSSENYCFLNGLPTSHAGSWQTGDTLECGQEHCRDLAMDWANMDGASSSDWEAHFKSECALCAKRRDERNRLLAPDDPRVHEAPFLDAPYVHRNNEPKYHALLLRAQEVAKRKHKCCFWFKAEDTIHNPEEKPKDPKKYEAKLERFLQFHDQRTGGLPGLCPLYRDLQVRTTEKIVRSKEIVILKHTSCKVVGWQLHEMDQRSLPTGAGGERYLERMPKVIFVEFADVTWCINGLKPGVLPLEPVQRQWIINDDSDAKATRKGYHLLPDYASTAFMMQGATVEALLADCGDVLAYFGLNEMVAAYVALSRVKTATGLLLLRAFAPDLFDMGLSPGPHCLLRLLRARFSDCGDSYSPADAQTEYEELVQAVRDKLTVRKKIGRACLADHSLVVFACKVHAVPIEDSVAFIADVYILLPPPFACRAHLRLVASQRSTTARAASGTVAT